MTRPWPIKNHAIRSRNHEAIPGSIKIIQVMLCGVCGPVCATPHLAYPINRENPPWDGNGRREACTWLSSAVALATLALFAAAHSLKCFTGVEDGSCQLQICQEHAPAHAQEQSQPTELPKRHREKVLPCCCALAKLRRQSLPACGTRLLHLALPLAFALPADRTIVLALVLPLPLATAAVRHARPRGAAGDLRVFRGIRVLRPLTLACPAWRAAATGGFAAAIGASAAPSSARPTAQLLREARAVSCFSGALRGVGCWVWCASCWHGLRRHHSRSCAGPITAV